MKLRSFIIISVAASSLLLSIGCSGIRVVRASKTGGEIALTGNREDAMEKAREEMARTCGGPQNYEVVEEGETAIGTVSNSQSNEQTSGGTTWSGKPATRTSGSSSTETTQKTEWRVKYACKGANAPPAATPAASGSTSLHQVIVRY